MSIKQELTKAKEEFRLLSLYQRFEHVVIAIQFKKSLLVVAERRDTIVQIRSVVMIALLAICRKVIILDLTETDALHILALAAAILALGIVYWLIRNSDQRLDEAA